VDDEPQGAAGLGRTQQDNPPLPILREVAHGVHLIHFAGLEPCGTDEAPALHTAPGEVVARLPEGVQEVRLLGDVEPEGPLWGHDLHRVGPGHKGAYGLEKPRFLL